MIDAGFATVVIIAFILLFGVGVPILNIKIPKFISYRWSVVVVVLALLIGAVVDFERLSDDARHIVLMGGIIIAGVYVVLRTIEKALANGWLHGATIEASKGDAKVVIKSDTEDCENDDSK